MGRVGAGGGGIAHSHALSIVAGKKEGRMFGF